MFQDLPDEIKTQVIRNEVRASRINQRANKNYNFELFCELPISEKEFARNPISGFIFVTSPGSITQDFHIFKYSHGDYNYLKSIIVSESDYKEFDIRVTSELEPEYKDLKIDDIWYDLNITKELYKLRKQCKNADFFAGQQLKRIYSLAANSNLEEIMDYLKKMFYLTYNYRLKHKEIVDFVDNLNLGFDYQGQAFDEETFTEYKLELVEIYERMLAKVGL